MQHFLSLLGYYSALLAWFFILSSDLKGDWPCHLLPQTYLFYSASSVRFGSFLVLTTFIYWDTTSIGACMLQCTVCFWVGCILAVWLISPATTNPMRESTPLVVVCAWYYFYLSPLVLMAFHISSPWVQLGCRSWFRSIFSYFAGTAKTLLPDFWEARVSLPYSTQWPWHWWMSFGLFNPPRLWVSTVWLPYMVSSMQSL